jgi:hypothetical protein
MLGVQKDVASESLAGSSNQEAVSGEDAPSVSVPSGGEGQPEGLGTKPAPAPGKPDPTGESNPYSPNYKFKVLDKELEFDEFLRGAIKDPDTEKKVRELYEKAHGLESVKSDRTTLRNELTQTKDKIAKTEAGLETIASYVRKGDYDSFFESLGIPKENILKYALELVQREQDPNKLAQWQANRQAQQQAQHYQSEAQRLEQERTQFYVQQKEFELSQAMIRPEISGIVQAYDAGMGQPGAFRQYVIRMGQALESQGQDVSTDQAIQEAVRHLQAVNPNLTAAPMGQPRSTGVVQPNQKPVIPNIQGRGTSPVRSSYRSLDDLRKLAKERTAMGE